MLETSHVLVGAAIAVKIGNPLFTIPLALASHFVLDIVPHWNPHLNKEVEKFGNPSKKSTVIVIIDSSLALFSGSYVACRALPNISLFLTILLSCFFAVLPDLIEAPYFFLNIRNNKFIIKWIKFQRSIQTKSPLIPGLITQALVMAAVYLWIR